MTIIACLIAGIISPLCSNDAAGCSAGSETSDTSQATQRLTETEKKHKLGVGNRAREI